MIDKDTGPQTTETDMHDRAHMAITEHLAAKSCLLLGAVSILTAVATARDPELRPWYDASQTGVMLSGGFLILWALAHAIRGSTRERRHQHDEQKTLAKTHYAALVVLQNDHHAEATDLQRKQHAAVMAALAANHREAMNTQHAVNAEILAELRAVRGDHTEFMDGFKASAGRYAELMNKMDEFADKQDEGAEIVGDVLRDDLKAKRQEGGRK